MSNVFLKVSELLQGLNTTKTFKGYDLPEDYIVTKFYELGFYPQYNRGRNTYQCSCPVCREGKSFGRKKRCFYLPDKNKIFCHNCGWSNIPFFWIKEVGGLEDDEIWSEVSQESYDLVDLDKLNADDRLIKSASLPDDCINLFDPLQTDYYHDNDIVSKAKQYLYDRRIDRSINRPDSVYISLKDRYHKNRIVFPFKNEDGDIMFYQSRTLLSWDERPSYLGRINCDKSLFGVEKVTDADDTIYIFEGPIDSCFIRNGVALGGITEDNASFTPQQEAQISALIGFDQIWCLDSQYKDATSRMASKRLLDDGKKVFIWPEELGKQYKDLNELCIDKKLNGISGVFIKKNTFQGREGVLKLAMITG